MKSVIPGSIWNRPAMLVALQSRNLGQVLRLLRQHAGISQTTIGSLIGMSQGKVSGIMAGSQRVTALEVYERIAEGLHMPDNARVTLGLAPRQMPGWTAPPQALDPSGFTPSLEDDRGQEDSAVQRRQFVGLTGAALFNAVLTGSKQTPEPAQADVNDLAIALTEPPALASGIISSHRLSELVAAAKSDYQSCRYGKVLTVLPPLLRTLRAKTAIQSQPRLLAMLAEAYHVAASILLKQGDKGLASLAADRSVQAAERSEIPSMIGSSARIVTHVLINGGHHRAAATNASTIAGRMNTAVRQPTNNDLSVYGALLLRGAVAAAHNDDRNQANDLLNEAEQTSRRLGHEGNHMWTAFGPSNVLCHRVNVAVQLGDAGTALDYARRVNIDALPVNERKAVLLIDVTRAFLMWGKYYKALHTLQAAEQIAPEEITGRPTIRRLVHELVTTAPISVHREARDFAGKIGIIT